MLILSAMPSVAAAVPAVFLVGAASIVYMTTTTSLAQVDTRRDMQGRVLALQTAIMGGAALFGGPLVGQISDIGGGRAPIVVGGAVCLAVAGFGHLAGRRASPSPI
jgi:hypothetical protein